MHIASPNEMADLYRKAVLCFLRPSTSALAMMLQITDPHCESTNVDSANATSS
jgi:hypothetical protein